MVVRLTRRGETRRRIARRVNLSQDAIRSLLRPELADLRRRRACS
jgi:DNA-binding CsgD family transcriptional regulator